MIDRVLARIVACAIGVLLLLPVTAIAFPPSDSRQSATGGSESVEWALGREHWYELRLGDAPCGWMSSQEWSSKDGALRRSISESLVRFVRGGQSIEVTMATRFDETSRGEPISCQVRQQSGQAPVVQDYRFDRATPNRVTVESTQGGRTMTSTIELPAESWMTPLAADAFASARRAAGVQEYKIRTVDPQSGMKLVEVTATLLGTGTFTRDGREIPTTRWSIANSLVPLPTEEAWSSDAVLLHSVTTMALGRMEARLSDRATALRAAKGPAMELMVKTLTRPDRHLRGVGGLSKSHFRVSALEGDLPLLPDVGAQRVERISPSVLEIRIDESAPLAATEAEIADARFRSASVVIDSDDDAIRALTLRTLEPLRGATPQNRAEALRRAVHRHIRKKGLGAAFATASETVRSAEGDCTEHAVLLAALLRADGIPSRVVTGLVYCDEFAGERNVFGWHMWTQALIDGAWIDLDATLQDSVPFHAGHIATGTSAQEQGSLDVEWISLVSLIGNLKIEVLETSQRDRAPRP